MSNIFLILFVIGFILYTVWSIVNYRKAARIEEMDDEDPFDGEWKDGDPNAPLPKDALKWDPLQPDESCCHPTVRRVKFNAEED